MDIKEIIPSKIDKSVNFIFDHNGDKIESRFVTRNDDEIIVYLSSDVGCNLSCRMCHLTRSNQTKSNPVDAINYIDQADYVLRMVEERNMLKNVKVIHFNFMAQGDSLLNKNFITGFDEIYSGLIKVAENIIGLSETIFKFKISTIFPEDSFIFSERFSRFFSAKDWIRDKIYGMYENVEFYYSLYSLKESFRKRWLPKSEDPEIIGSLFSGLDRGLVLHHALISGQNDSEEDIALIHDWMERHDLNARLNIVRYNPFDNKSGDESSMEVINNYKLLMDLSHRVTSSQIIPRVGTDCYASCGQFLYESI